MTIAIIIAITLNTNNGAMTMATTDQLRKAQQRAGLQLNDFPASKYIAALKEADFDVRGLTKLEAFKLVKQHNIKIERSW